MKNKTRITKFILESIVTLLPLCVSYLLLGSWLSDITDFGRVLRLPDGVNDLREAYTSSGAKYGWIAFDTFGQDFKTISISE